MAGTTGYEFDEGNMCVFDTGYDDDLQPAAEALVHRLFGLEKSENGIGVRVVVLPEPRTVLPREKRLKVVKDMTKWEKFAKEKGIQKKKKRDRMVWDETSQKFLPRYGYKSAKASKSVAMIADRPDIKPGENPFTKLAKEKKERVQVNKKKRLSNEGRIQKHIKLPDEPKKDKKGRKGKKGEDKVKPLAAVEAEVGPSGKAKIPHARLAASAKVAQLSTRSVGKFDRLVQNENVAKAVGKRRTVSKPNLKITTLTTSIARTRTGTKSVKVCDREAHILLLTEPSGFFVFSPRSLSRR